MRALQNLLVSVGPSGRSSSYAPLQLLKAKAFMLSRFWRVKSLKSQFLTAVISCWKIQLFGSLSHLFKWCLLYELNSCLFFFLKCKFSLIRQVPSNTQLCELEAALNGGFLNKFTHIKQTTKNVSKIKVSLKLSLKE